MPDMPHRATPEEVICHCPSARAAGGLSQDEQHDTVLHLTLSPGLDQGLRTFAKSHGIQPETAAREAIRAYVGDDR